MDNMAIWQELAERVAATDHAPSPELVRAMLAAGLRAADKRPYLNLTAGDGPRRAAEAPSEFLLPLDAGGVAMPLSPPLVGALDSAVPHVPEGQNWLSHANLQGQPVLLAARWLCHRIGLRHQTAQLILDHPTNPALTLIQVRGLDKEEAPGAFDLPCAGHVVGLDTPLQALARELREELGLTFDALVDLSQVARYESRDLPDWPVSSQEPDRPAGFMNVELRTVYRARLRAEALVQVHFADQEAGALAIMGLATLEAWIARRPERIASGLRGAIALYAGRS